MTAFDEIYSDSAVPALMDHMGTAVTYLDPEEDDLELTAIVSNTDVVEVDGAASGGRRKRQMRSFTVARDPAGPYGGVEHPKLGGAFRMADGEVWEIEAIESQGESLMRCACGRKSVVEQSRAGYRGK